MTATTQVELLSGLTDSEAEAVVALGFHETVPSGAQLFRLGDVAKRIYVIQRGRVRLTLPMLVRGREEDVAAEERGPGETIGWSALIPPYRFTLSATAPLETEVIALPREALLQHFFERPDVGYRVTMNLAAAIGLRLQLFQAMWLREMQRTVELRSA